MNGMLYEKEGRKRLVMAWRRDDGTCRVFCVEKLDDEGHQRILATDIVPDEQAARRFAARYGFRTAAR